MLQFDGQPWAPTRYTKPLTGRLLDSDGPRLVALLERHWRLPSGDLVRYDDWQKALLNHVLERYPADWPNAAVAGRLRFRQAVASMGRQNGKSLIGGALAIYGLTQHVAAPSIVGIATSVEQANVVYRRVRYAVENSPLLNAMLAASGTRGIRWRDGRGDYTVKPAKTEGLQSVPVTLGIADELHLLWRSMWYSIVNGQRAQTDALVAGITTAGDELSELLVELYARGDAAIADPEADQRFGFWLWEAPEDATIHTPGALEAANPALACGRLDRATFLADVAKSPVTDQQRYALNRFVLVSKSWADFELWDASPAATIEEPAVFGVARGPSWDYVTITAAAKTDGHVGVETVASLRGIDRDALMELLDRLAAAHPSAAFAMDARNLGEVGKQLRAAGRDVWLLTKNETAAAAHGVYARITGGTLGHDHWPLIRRQLAMSRQTRDNEGAWRIVPGAGGGDALLATIWAAHVADIAPEPAPQIF